MTKSKKYALISLIISAASLFGIFLPNLFGMDGFDGGFAVSTVCLAVFITAIICTGVFWWLAGKEQRIIQGEHLAHWTYMDDEWTKFAQMERKMDASSKKILFFMIVGFAVLFGVIFMIADPENGIYVAYAMAGLIVLMGLVAWLSVRSASKNLNRKGEAYITKDGILINGVMHFWSIPGSRLESANLHQETDPKYIVFTYSFVARYGRQSNEVRVPVPKVKEADAAGIISKLKP